MDRERLDRRTLLKLGFAGASTLVLAQAGYAAAVPEEKAPKPEVKDVDIKTGKEVESMKLIPVHVRISALHIGKPRKHHAWEKPRRSVSPRPVEETRGFDAPRHAPGPLLIHQRRLCFDSNSRSFRLPLASATWFVALVRASA